MKTSVFLLTLFIILFSHCKRDKELCNCNHSIINEITDNRLYFKWVFESFENLSGICDKPGNRLNDMTIEFLDSGRVVLKGIINEGGGYYQCFKDNCIEISGLVRTELGGTNLENKWEDEYWDSLENSNCYEINGDKLVIYFYYKNRHKAMNFKKS